MMCAWAPVDAVEDSAEVPGQRVGGGGLVLPATVGSELAVSVHASRRSGMTATASTTAPAQATEEIQDAGHVDVLISAPGFPASVPRTPARPVPRPNLRHPGRPGQPRRDLVDPSVPGGALGQRLVHLRLPVQAVARPSIAAGEEILATSARSLTEYALDHTSATSTGYLGQLVHGGPPVDVEVTRATPGSGCGSPRFL